MKKEDKLIEDRLGFSYIEVIISISLFIVLAFIIDVLLINRLLQTKTEMQALAHQIAQEELEVVRNYPFELLTTTTDGMFIGVLYNKGTVELASTPDAFSGSQVVDVASASSTATTTGQLVLPKNSYSDATITAQLRFISDSPTPFGGGMFFRALDDQNGYLLKLSSTNDLTLDVISSGTVTNIINQLQTIVADTWYDLELTLSGDYITLDINGLPIFSTTDSTFSEGYASIVATDEAHVWVDDVTVVETGTTAWDFDADPLGKLTDEWLRPGLSDLPSSTAKLTITNYLGSDLIKTITAEVEWYEAGATTTISETTLLTDF
jgi:hypothetical protein